MNLMVKYILLVLQAYSVVCSAVLQGSAASTHFEPASGPEGNIPVNESPPNVAAPIISIPEVSLPIPPVISPTIPVSVPPIPQPNTRPTIKSPVNPPTISAQPPKDAIQNPPPMAQAVPPFISQVPPSMPQAPPPKEVIQDPPPTAQAPPPFILPEPVASPPTRLPMAPPPTRLPMAPPPTGLPMAPPPTRLPMAPPPTRLPMAPPPNNLPLPADIPPSTLPSSPPMPPIVPVPPSNFPGPVASPPSTLPINSPPSPPTSTVPLPSFPVPIASPPSTLPTNSTPNLPAPVASAPTTLPKDSPPSPPTSTVPLPNLPVPAASPPTTLPRDSPPSPPALTMPPPNLAAPVASAPSTLPRDSPPSSPTLNAPPPNLPVPVPVASPPQSSQRNAPLPQATFAEPPSKLPVPVALPPNNSPRNLQPIHHNSSFPPPNLPHPHISPVSTPILPSPPNQRPPVKAPVVQKAPPPYSSHESPPTKSRPPPSLPPVYPPPPPGPKSKPVHHNPPPPSGPDSPPTHNPSPPPPSPGLKVPPFENSVSPSIAPPTASPPVETTIPVFPPKVSPTRSSPRIPKPLPALPPPPPNEDCLSTACVEPLTNTPPGTPCKCVLPMQVELGLGVSLYTFFPLVTELAVEMAAGLFMESSQVRIMGANEDDQDSEKTLVIINLVPLGERFDNVSAYVTAQRLWLKEVLIKYSLFGDYEVLYVRYPGLPPSPPMPSSRNGGYGEPYGHGNNGRDIKPLGVDVSKQRRNNKISGGVISIIALSGVVVVVLACVAVWVLLLKHRDNGVQSGPTPTTTLASVTKSSGVGGSMTGSVPESTSLSFRSSIHYNGSAKTFTLSEMEKATDNFNESGVLGEGGFGRVYSGVLEDGTKVAVKLLKRDDQQGGREFLAEVEMLSRLHHRNLVRLLGICTEERHMCLVYELIANGSVESHLHGIDKETAPLDWLARLKIALGAARGLAYLHEDSSPRVIHRDFKSSNILLEEDFTPKVSDFGLARSALDEENQHISTRVMGTFGYVAPEYAMTGHLLVKSDVYSYGVVLLELLSGRKPIDMSMPLGQENLATWARPLLSTPEGLNLLIDPKLLLEVPFDSIAKVAAIASMCVQADVSHRPFMGEVVQALKLVCNECEETQDLGSRSCSHEDLTSLETGPGPAPSRSNYPTYESPLDVESGFSGLGLDADSYRLTSSSGPLRPKRRLQIWEKMKRFSSGSMSDYGDFLRLLSRSR